MKYTSGSPMVAAPLVGGLVSSTIMVLFYWVHSWQHRKMVRTEGSK